MNIKKIVGFIVLLQCFASPALGWGGRGHEIICRSAVHLVKNEELRNFLKLRPHTMAHLCNLPDTYWKGLSKDVRRLGDTAHYIDPEILGLNFGMIPLDFKEIAKTFNGTLNHFDQQKKIGDVAIEFGSVWWRVDQFYRRLSQLKDSFQKASPPKNKDEEQQADLPFNLAVFQLYTEMGLMGHFVGDLNQPYHNTADHDGYASGHGGIHAYYEEALVGELDPKAELEIIEKAKKIKPFAFFKEKTILAQMRGLSQLVALEVNEIEKKDTVLKKSEVSTDSNGVKKRIPAQRWAASQNFKKFEPLLIKELSRASFLLAHYWDEIYENVGKPPLTSYRSYRYPFTVEFIALDYLQ